MIRAETDLCAALENFLNARVTMKAAEMGLHISHGETAAADMNAAEVVADVDRYLSAVNHADLLHDVLRAKFFTYLMDGVDAEVAEL